MSEFVLLALPGLLYELRRQHVSLPPGSQDPSSTVQAWCRNSFDPFSVRGSEGLAGLAKDPLTREHLENLAQQGWSPIKEGSAEEETESQKGARVIAKKNFGGVINRETTTFLDQDVKDDMFSNRSTKQVLIPATGYLRNCIKVYVEACEPSSLETMC